MDNRDRHQPLRTSSAHMKPRTTALALGCQHNTMDQAVAGTLAPLNMADLMLRANIFYCVVRANVGANFEYKIWCFEEEQRSQFRFCCLTMAGMCRCSFDAVLELLDSHLEQLRGDRDHHLAQHERQLGRDRDHRSISDTLQ